MRRDELFSQDEVCAQLVSAPERKACFGRTRKPARYKRALSGLAIFVALVFASMGSLRAAVEINAIEVTVAELPRALAFYTGVLQFQLVSQATENDRTVAQLRLGAETLILRDYARDGRRIPRDLPANDLSFQHIAIVTGDIDAAYARLLENKTEIVSAGVQRLPDWNFDAAGIRALYFRDPDGHFLELIQFPGNKGEPRWHRPSGPLFRGIDHSAIVVSDLKRSVAFYRDTLGLTISGESCNYGGEQELLNRVTGSRVRITSLRGAKGPGIELLHYERPGAARAEQGKILPNDSSAWRIDLENTRVSAEREAADPDGHTLLVRPRTLDGSRMEYPWEALRQHWSRYLMEGAQLGIFMAVALGLALVLEYPKSRAHQAISSPLLRRFIFGLGIGLTVVILIYSHWGRQSGAHFNPAVTLSMLYLHRIQPWDACFYLIAQFLGGWLGVVLTAAPFWKASAHPKVNFVVTVPGKPGVAVAFAAEFIISFILMATLRLAHQHDATKPLLGYFAGVLLVLYITFESPLSGMSLNPARSVASAVPARDGKALWIYFVAPPLAMWLAVVLCG